MTAIVNTNMMALNAQRNMNKTSQSLQTSMERLSSGMRVNSAKDDAAGLAIADGMTSQIRGMTVAVRNANDGISMAQTAEGAMGEITNTLQRMRDLAVQSRNFGAVGSSDRQKLQEEFGQLGKEINRVIGNTTFNGKAILKGSLSKANFQVGFSTGATNQISITLSKVSAMAGISKIAANATPLSIGSGATSTAVSTVIDEIDKAIKAIDSSRAKLGAVQNRFLSTISNLNTSIENQSAARSRIMDADFATETANLSKAKVLQQAGTAMLSQANQAPQGVLKLLG
jgi:flagellin